MRIITLSIAMANLYSILKNKNITLLTKLHIIKGTFFPAVMYQCERWTIKKAESQWINAFKLWYWRGLLRVLWTTRRSNQSILKEINQIFIGRTDVEAEAPILWLPDAKSRLIGKDPVGGKDWQQEEKEMTENEMVGWHHRFSRHELEQTPGDGKEQGSLSCMLQSMRSQRVRHNWVTEQQQCPCMESRKVLQMSLFAGQE